MAFCTNCGSSLGAEARFCTNCGSSAPAGGGVPVVAAPPVAAAPAPPPPVSAQPLEYQIQGDNLQVARVKLKPGQELYAEAGRMVYKTANVLWETRMGGSSSSLGDLLLGAVRRKMMGQSLFLTYFQVTGGVGEVGFAGSYPGRIQVFELAAGQSVLVERDSFLFAQSSAQLNIAFVKKLGAGFFGGEGFILEKLTGPGAVFIHGGGDFIEFPLGPGEQIQIETGNIVAFDESVSYDIQFVGSIKTAMFGGEGLFLATLTGPGRVIVQSMTLEKMRRQLAPYKHGGDEHKSGLDVFSGIFDNND